MIFFLFFIFRNYHAKDPSDKGIPAVTKRIEGYIPPQAIFRLIYGTYPGKADVATKMYPIELVFGPPYKWYKNYSLNNPKPNIRGLHP